MKNKISRFFFTESGGPLLVALSSQSAVWQAIAIVTPRELGAPDRHPDSALGAVQPLTRLVEIVQSATIAMYNCI